MLGLWLVRQTACELTLTWCGCSGLVLCSQIRRRCIPVMLDFDKTLVLAMDACVPV